MITIDISPVFKDTKLRVATVFQILGHEKLEIAAGSTVKAISFITDKCEMEFTANTSLVW